MNVYLAAGLRERGIDAQILYSTDEHENRPLDFEQSTIPFHAIGDRRDPLPARWAKLQKMLRGAAPCVWLPADFDLSVAVHGLPLDVVTIGVIHSDDPVHYDHASRLGRYWNAVVAVSNTIADSVTTSNPHLASRVSVIRYGVPIRGATRPRSSSLDGPLKIVYTGRIAEYQKRVSRIVAIARRLEERGIPSEFTIIGSGPDEEQFRKDVTAYSIEGRFVFRGFVPLDKMMAEYPDHDVFLLTSDFEGLPVSLLEAMACGCVPIVSDISSGIPELVENERNGFRIPPADIDCYANRLADLHHDRDRLAALSQAAMTTIDEEFGSALMVTQYVCLMEQLVEEAGRGAFRRPRRRPRLPRNQRPILKHYLPAFARHLIGRVRKGLRDG